MEFFSQLDASNQIALVAGALVTLAGVFQIVKHGIRLLLWVVLVAIGVTAINFGAKGQLGSFASEHLIAQVKIAMESGQPWAMDLIGDLCSGVNDQQTRMPDAQSPLERR